MITGRQDRRTTNEYIIDFKIYISHSGITSDFTFIKWFIKGSNPRLARRIRELDNISDQQMHCQSCPTGVSGYIHTLLLLYRYWFSLTKRRQPCQSRAIKIVGSGRV